MKYKECIIKIIIIITIIKILNCENNNKQLPIICGIQKCDLIGGFCSKYINCTCNKGYDTFIKKNDLKCNYKMYSKFKAGILEFFFGFGIGHFYSLRYNFGKFKCSLYLFFIICCIISFFQIKRIRNEEEANDHPNVSICVISTICFFIILIFWQFIDCILFWSGFYLDGNQMKMN